MPNLNTRRFTAPDVLSKIRRESLLQWLAPANEYLISRDVVLPAVESADLVDYEKLAGVFFDPDETMPAYLVNSVFIIGEMADEAGMDAILDAAEKGGLVLEVGDDPAPVDVAVQAWLQDPELLEEIHNQYQLTRPRSFVHFACALDVVPAFMQPKPEFIEALEKRLADWFGRKKRGYACRVLVYPQGKECCFLVRHGETCKREGALKDGKSDTVFYRPQTHDVVIYDIEAGELRMNAVGIRQMREYREAFGMHVFADDRFFGEEAKYSLLPLESGRKCLVCTDIVGIDWVMLKDVEIFYPGKPWQRITRKSDDIYELVEKELFRWPSADRLTKATFEIKFTGSDKTCRVKILGANKAQYGDVNPALVEQWLKARGFIPPQDADEERLVA